MGLSARSVHRSRRYFPPPTRLTFLLGMVTVALWTSPSDQVALWSAVADLGVGLIADSGWVMPALLALTVGFTRSRSGKMFSALSQTQQGVCASLSVLSPKSLRR
jgi:hypothetical protein